MHVAGRGGAGAIEGRTIADKGDATKKSDVGVGGVQGVD